MGSGEAQDELLRIYESFHDSLLAYAEAGMDGCIHHETREDWKSMVQMECQWIYRHLMELQREGSLTQYDVSELRLLIEMLLDYIAAKK